MADYRKYVSAKLSSVVSGVTQPIYSKRGVLEGRLLSEWPLIVGEELAAHTFPKHVSYAKEEATLHLNVEAALAMEVSYQVELVQEKIATYFGYKAIHRIKLYQHQTEKMGGEKETSVLHRHDLDEHQKQTLEKMLVGVGDDALRQVITDLYASIKGSEEK